VEKGKTKIYGKTRTGASTKGQGDLKEGRLSVPLRGKLRQDGRGNQVAEEAMFSPGFSLVFKEKKR